MQATKDVNTIGNCQCWIPFTTQDIEGYPSARGNVRMIDSSGEVDVWSLQWVFRGDPNRQVEHAAFIWSIGLNVGVSTDWCQNQVEKSHRPHDICLPVELLFVSCKGGLEGTR